MGALIESGCHNPHNVIECPLTGVSISRRGFPSMAMLLGSLGFSSSRFHSTNAQPLLFVAAGSFIPMLAVRRPLQSTPSCVMPDAPPCLPSRIERLQESDSERQISRLPCYPNTFLVCKIIVHKSSTVMHPSSAVSVRDMQLPLLCLLGQLSLRNLMGSSNATIQGKYFLHVLLYISLQYAPFELPQSGRLSRTLEPSSQSMG